MTDYNGANLEKVQNLNRALVIKLLYRKHCNTRSAVARASGLKRATISNIVDDLIRWGLVKETGAITGEKGRRSIALELNDDKYVSICVHMYRDVLVFGILDIRGKQKGRLHRVSTAGMEPQKIIKIIRKKTNP
jgi:hypothetical protein